MEHFMKVEPNAFTRLIFTTLCLILSFYFIFRLLKMSKTSKTFGIESFRCGKTDKKHRTNLESCIKFEENKICKNSDKEKQRKCIQKTRLYCPQPEGCNRQFTTQHSSNRKVGDAEGSIIANQCQTKCNNIRMCCFNKNPNMYQSESVLLSKME